MEQTDSAVFSYEELLEQLQRERLKTVKLKAKVKALKANRVDGENDVCSGSSSSEGEREENENAEQQRGESKVAASESAFFSNRLDIDERGLSIFRDDDMKLGSSFDAVNAEELPGTRVVGVHAYQIYGPIFSRPEGGFMQIIHG